MIRPTFKKTKLLLFVAIGFVCNHFVYANEASVLYKVSKVVFLPKNKVKGRCVLTQKMLDKPNTTYIIKYDYELITDVNIPSNSVLVFDGGSINVRQYVITGPKMPTQKLYYPEQFGAGRTSDDTKAIQSCLNIAQRIKMDGIYNVYATSNNIQADNPVVCVPSNTNVQLNGKVYYKTTYLSRYEIFHIEDAHNVSLYGKGTIVGDKLIHQGHTGEWGFCIGIKKSFNVKIEGLEISYSWGDGVYIGFEKPFAHNICINNVKIHNHLRQGISIVGGYDISISNFNINTIDSSVLGCGIDIENETGVDGGINNICIKNGVIEDCNHGIYSHSGYYNSRGRIDNVIIDNVIFDENSDCRFDNYTVIRNCSIPYVRPRRGCLFEKCFTKSVTYIMDLSTENDRTEFVDSRISDYIHRPSKVGQCVFVNCNSGDSFLNINASGQMNFIDCNFKLASSDKTFSLIEGSLFESCTLHFDDIIGGYPTCKNCKISCELTGSATGIIRGATKLYNCTVDIIGTRNTYLYNLNRGKLDLVINNTIIKDSRENRYKMLSGNGVLYEQNVSYEVIVADR